MDIGLQALLESPWGQSILEEGERRGREKAAKRAQEEGTRWFLNRLIRRRFGEVPELVETTLQRLNMEQLEELSDVLFDGNSLDEFIAALPPITEE
ncbi:DUF4351 domain-containing protein [Laspinema olomoucense]|uniref:DUF4351 domain-containing protein n=1 Tax=Laspinema olomoucense TaxID=3231600 RepID=UPI0021BA758D|nr:DUF4351 domain-containing protein [Laspinema sp. D3c]MCT7994154.1 DUF4351 domain-containing protein [Laspinema sp. D3c]